MTKEMCHEGGRGFFFLRFPMGTTKHDNGVEAIFQSIIREELSSAEMFY